MTRPPAPPATVRWAGVARAVCLAFLMGACYWRTLDGGFFWDDHLVIPGNAVAQSLRGLWKVWFSTEPYDYYPLTYTALWVEWRLWEDAPLGYHLVGLVLGLSNAFLLWALLRKLRVPGSWIAALWFAIHPMNVASVAWIAEQKNLFSMLFYLNCLLAFVSSGALTEDRMRKRWYAASLGCFVLAALSKSSVVMLPFVLLLLVWWKRGEIGRRDWRRTLPFFAVSLAAGLGTIWFHHHRAMDLSRGNGLPVFARIALAGRVIAFYFAKAFVPVRLSMIYPRWDAAAFGAFTFLPCVVTAALLILVWTNRSRWGRGPFVALAYFVLTLLPVSGLLSAALFKDSYVFDHLAYLALAGLLAAAAAAAECWRRRGSPFLAALTTTLLTTLLVAGSLVRADDFSSSEKLWRSTVAINPASAAAWNNLGLALLDQRRLADAEPCFRTALRLQPGLPTAAINLAGLLQQAGRWDESASIYKIALAASVDARDFNNYGVLCLQLGDAALARVQFHRASQLEPRLLSPHFNLYKTFLSEGDLPAATDELGACLRVDPDDVPALLALALMDIRAASPGTIPANAVMLARRVRALAGSRDTLALEIVTRARSAPPASDDRDRLPEISAKVGRIVRELAKS